MEKTMNRHNKIKKTHCNIAITNTIMMLLIMLGNASIAWAVVCKGKLKEIVYNQQTIEEVACCSQIGATQTCTNICPSASRCYKKIYEQLPYTIITGSSTFSVE